MSSFAKSVAGVLGGANRAAKAYPVTVGCAAVFAVLSLLRIQFNWMGGAPYGFIINCAQWALALGAASGMAAVAAAQTYYGTRSAALIANLAALAAAAIVFASLYAAGSGDYGRITELAGTRVAAAIFVFVVAFVLIAGRPSDETDFPRAMFMTHKSFFIALLYGLVALGGASGVAGAVQGLIYANMSYKVYGYILTLSALLAFLLFVGYFPNLRAGADPERREKAQREPRFIEILLCYILVPVMLALTTVLLIWAVMNVFGVTKSSFKQLAAISAAYTLGGLWLHAMISGDDNGMAKLYRATYPTAAAVILAFEAWAVIARLIQNGLKTVEYIFILIWILAVAGCVLLLAMRGKKRPAAHRTLAVIACALMVFAVLPGVGYVGLPVAAQTARLESLLSREGMLSGGKLTPAATEPVEATRAAITDAVEYLAYSGGKLPPWLEKSFAQSDSFTKKFGFEKTWINSGVTVPGSTNVNSLYLTAPNTAVDITGYRWAVNIGGAYKGRPEFTLKGERGEYAVRWIVNDKGLPTLKIERGGAAVLEQPLDGFIGGLLEKYPLGTGSIDAAKDELTMTISGDGIKVLLTLDTVSVNEYSDGRTEYWISPGAIFINEE